MNAAVLAGEYDPKAKIEKEQQAASESPGQLSLLDLMEDKPSDEGEFLKSYITDYRRVQEYGD